MPRGWSRVQSQGQWNMGMGKVCSPGSLSPISFFSPSGTVLVWNWNIFAQTPVSEGFCPQGSDWCSWMGSLGRDRITGALTTSVVSRHQWEIGRWQKCWVEKGHWRAAFVPDLSSPRLCFPVTMKPTALLYCAPLTMIVLSSHRSKPLWAKTPETAR